MRENDLTFLCLPIGRLWCVSVPPASGFRAIVHVVPEAVSLAAVTVTLGVAGSVADVWVSKEETGWAQGPKSVPSACLIIHTTWPSYQLSVHDFLIQQPHVPEIYLAPTSPVTWFGGWGSADLDWTWMIGSPVSYLSRAGSSICSGLGPAIPRVPHPSPGPVVQLGQVSLMQE